MYGVIDCTTSTMRTRIKVLSKVRLNNEDILKEVEMISQRRKEIQKLTEQFKTNSISWMTAKKWATSMYDNKQLNFK